MTALLLPASMVGDHAEVLLRLAPAREPASDWTAPSVPASWAEDHDEGLPCLTRASEPACEAAAALAGGCCCSSCASACTCILPLKLLLEAPAASTALLLGLGVPAEDPGMSLRAAISAAMKDWSRSVREAAVLPWAMASSRLMRDSGTLLPAPPSATAPAALTAGAPAWPRTWAALAGVEGAVAARPGCCCWEVADGRGTLRGRLNVERRGRPALPLSSAQSAMHRPGSVSPSHETHQQDTKAE